MWGPHAEQISVSVSCIGVACAIVVTAHLKRILEQACEWSGRVTGALFDKQASWGQSPEAAVS